MSRDGFYIALLIALAPPAVVAIGAALSLWVSP